VKISSDDAFVIAVLFTDGGRLGTEIRSMKKTTNFDRYLAGQLRDPAFARRYRQAEEEWNVALQLAALREGRGLTQRDVARLVGTTQQQISRMESADYRGHSLSALRKVATALGGRVRVLIESAPAKPRRGARIPAGRHHRRAA
jgi:DNA-binding XRE family transcriptional regulator